MSGHKVKLEFLNIDYLKKCFLGKAINRVSIDFECIENTNYPPHEKIYLVREKRMEKLFYLKILPLKENNILVEN